MRHLNFLKDRPFCSESCSQHSARFPKWYLTLWWWYSNFPRGVYSLALEDMNVASALWRCPLSLPQSHSIYQHHKPRGALGWATSRAPSCCFHRVCQYHGLCDTYDAVPTRWSQVSDNSFMKIQSLGCVMVCGLDIRLKSNFLIKKPGISLKLHWHCIQHL